MKASDQQPNVGKARRLLEEARTRMWPRLVDRTPQWRRAEWWERRRREEALLVLVPILILAIRFLIRVVTHGH